MAVLKIVYYVFLIVAALFLYARIYEAKLLFLPSRKFYATPRDIGLPYEDVFFLSEGGVPLNGWLVRNPRARATVLFFHGNAGNISNRMDKIALFYKMGLNVFIIDYRGYGKSEGRSSEEGMYRDAEAAYDFLMKKSGLEKTALIIYGESLGGAAAVDLASRHPSAALIADSTFSSARDMARAMLPIVPSFMISLRLDSVSKIGQVTAPKLFIHSPYDEIVPFRLAKKLFNAATEPKEFLKIDGDHNAGYSLDYQTYRDGIAAFLRKNGLIDN